MRVELLTNPADIPSEEWDALVASTAAAVGPEMGLKWLSFLAGARGDADARACPPVSLLAARETFRTTALLAFVEEDNLHVTLREGEGDWRAPAALGRGVRGYHCRVPLAHTLAVLHQPGTEGINGLSKVVETLEKKALSQGLDYVQISRVEPGSPLQTLLAERGYESYPNFLDHVLQISWSSLSEYALSLRQKARQNMRREMQRFRDRGIDTVIIDRYTEALPQLYALHEAVCRRHGGRPHMRFEFFEKALKSLRGFGGIVAQEQGRPVGCFFFFVAHGCLSCKNAGLVYDVSRGSFVYANLLYKSIDYAIEQGFKRVHFGLTNRWQKVRLGALPFPSERRILALAPDLAKALADLRLRLKEQDAGVVQSAG